MEEPIRVLHYGMSPNVGGIECFIMNIYRKIDRNKVQFDFLTFCDKIAFADEIEKLGGRIYRLISRKENILENYRQLNTFFNEHKEYKIVHCHLNTCSYITPLVVASKSCERHVIAHSHNEWRGKKLTTKILHRINKAKVISLSDYLFACSNAAGKYMFGEKVFNSSKYKLIKNAIDAELYRYNPEVRNEIRKKLRIEDKFVVGHVGRLSYQKNHNFLLDIFNEVYKSNKDAVLLLVGGGELEKQIKEKINRLELGSVVKMLGVRHDIPQIMQAMDVFLFPSHFEGFPVTLVEAQAAGLKAIVSDIMPRDVGITDLIEFISLKQPASFWAQQVLKHSHNHVKRDTYDEIVKFGYDLKENVKWLEKFYLKNQNA